MANDKKAWVYQGGGYAPGVPASDLTGEQFDALSAEEQEMVRTSDLYKQPGATAPAKKKSGA